MKPFRMRARENILELALDTPSSSVNVFGPAAAAQLDEVLGAVPSHIETILVRSAKPGSFINGAGLLYANAMQSAEAALRVSAPVRAVYERLASATVRTVALIEGNCFGCGLELALACDVRLARDIPETEFRMTEVTDYRFVPLFGGTWRLPRRVGVERAAELLLDGARWTARAARSRNLVDAVIAGDASEHDVMSLVANARPSRRKAQDRPTRRSVPPTRAGLWREVESLLRTGIHDDPEVCLQREVAAFARTVVDRAAKNAMGFFFVRHTARAASLGSAQRSVPRVRLRFARTLANRTASLVQRTAPTRTITFASPRMARCGRIALFFPLGAGAPFCELSTPRSDLDEARKVGEALAWLGVEPIVTLAGVSNRLLAGTRDLLRQLVARGVSPAKINRAFWEVGFERPFRFRGWSRSRASVPPNVPVVGHFATLWQHTLEEALREGALLHPSQGEVLIHALFDFPLELGMFGRWQREVRSSAAA
jgi:enoyl-CoA hydratase/carnithine racemase